MATTQEVIEALQAEGLSEETIKYIVPILAYESRVGNTPYVLDAKDELSESYGLGQVNIETMESAIWMALNESDIEIPGATEQQIRQWNTAMYQEGEEDVRNFTEEQRKFVIDYLLNKADLQFNAKVVKHMIHQKQLENKGMSEMDAILDLYVLTPRKFDINNTNFEDFTEKDAEEAQRFKEQIDTEVESFYTTPPTTTPPTTTPPTGGREERVLEATKSERDLYESQVGPAVSADQSFEEAKLKTDIARGNSPDYVKYKSLSDYQMKNFLLKNINNKRKKLNKPLLSELEPMQDMPQAAPVADTSIQFPYGRPVNIDEVLDFLEP